MAKYPKNSSENKKSFNTPPKNLKNKNTNAEASKNRGSNRHQEEAEEANRLWFSANSNEEGERLGVTHGNHEGRGVAIGNNEFGHEFLSHVGRCA